MQTAKRLFTLKNAALLVPALILFLGCARLIHDWRSTTKLYTAFTW
jgi:hypothetical protein